MSESQGPGPDVSPPDKWLYLDKMRAKQFVPSSAVKRRLISPVLSLYVLSSIGSMGRQGYLRSVASKRASSATEMYPSSFFIASNIRFASCSISHSYNSIVAEVLCVE